MLIIDLFDFHICDSIKWNRVVVKWIKRKMPLSPTKNSGLLL